MNDGNDLPKRKDIRLKDYDYSSPGAYFVTICTKDKKNYFWNGSVDLQTFKWCYVGATCGRPQNSCIRPKNLPLSDIGMIVADELEHWNQTYPAVSLHSYVIMPNHLHAIVVISNEECGAQVATTLGRMVNQFKGAATKKIGEPIWQKSYFEHVIRNKEEYEIISKYIYENPFLWYCDELYE